MVRLQSPTRGPFYATLTTVRDDNVILRFDRREAVLQRADFEQLWSGEYTLLWRPPFETKKALSEGSSGPAVMWLSSALAQHNGQSLGNLSARFDASLSDQVKQFQQHYALIADGVVGTQTLIALSSRQPDARPRLDGVNWQ
jgi:general secretion pathway protein A